MTLHWKNAFSLRKVFGHLRSCQDVFLVQKCSSSKWTHPRAYNDESGLFFEEALEERVNVGGPPFLGPHSKTKRMSTRKQMELQERKFIKYKIIKKKEAALYSQKQPGLLTWAAKSQIQHLHKQDPIYWTPEMLAESFPASVDVIMKVLKNSRHIARDEDYILRHDQRVYTNWLKLKKARKNFIEGRPVDPEFRSLVESDKMNLMKNAAGCLALPVPVSGYVTEKALAESRRPKTRGEFSAILEDYSKQKEEIKQEKSSQFIEIEDPNYIALLTSISEMNVNDEEQETDMNESELVDQMVVEKKLCRRSRRLALENDEFISSESRSDEDTWESRGMENVSRNSENYEITHKNTYKQNGFHRNKSFARDSVDLDNDRKGLNLRTKMNKWMKTD